MRNKKVLMEELLKSVDLVEVSRLINSKHSISKRGKTRCPLHEDKHPSFTCRSFQGIDRWKCFAGCGSGTVIDFIIKAKKAANIGEAMKWLVDNNLIDPSALGDEDQKNSLMSGLEEYRKHQALYERFWAFVKDGLAANTARAQEARDYFLTRGISSVETLTSRFKVGFFESSRLKDYGFSQQELKSLGLVDSGKRVVCDNAICFMYQKTFGEYSGFKLRPMGGNKARFFSLGRSKKKDTDIGFFGLTCIDSSVIRKYQDSDVIVVEGEFDVLVPQYKALQMYGETFNIVCRSGSAATSIQAFKNLKEHGIHSIAVFPDSDEAGREFIKATSRNAFGHGLLVDVVWPVQYNKTTPTDPADLCKDMDCNQIQDLILNSRRPISKYLATEAFKTYEGLKAVVADESNLRITAAHEFAKIANEYNLSDLMRDEFSFEVETLVKDVRLTASRIRAELDHKTSAGETYEIRGEKYMVTPKGYEKWISTDSEGSGFAKRITNFCIKYDKMIQFPGNEEWEIEGSIHINGRPSHNTFLINSSELVTPDSFNNLIRRRHPVGIVGLKDIKDVLPDIVSMSNSTVPQFRGVDRIGYIAGTRSYVTPSTIIQDGEFQENIEFQVARSDTTVRQYFESIDFSMQELSSANLREAANVLLEFYLECLPKRITLITLGHTFGSVLTPFFSRHLPPNALFLRGLAGSYKSTFAKLNMCLFYKGSLHEQKCLHANHTVNSIQTCISYVDNAPLVLDDIKAERKGVEDVMLVIQSLYDEQGRSRLNKNYTVLEGRPARNQGLIITGESVPTNQLSILSRMLQVEFIKSKADTKKFAYLEDNSDCMRMLMPYYIRWLQRRYADSYIQMVDFDVNDYPGFRHERAYHQVRKLLTSLSVFFEFLGDEVKVPKALLAQLLTEARHHATDLFLANVIETKAATKESRFLADITNYLRNGIFSVDGTLPGCNSIIGRRASDGTVILNAAQLRLALTSRSESRETGAIVGQILKDLEYQGKCKKVRQGEYSFTAKDILPQNESNEDVVEDIVVDTDPYESLG